MTKTLNRPGRKPKCLDNPIQRARLAKGYTLRDVALSLGWIEARISNYETGLRRPSRAALEDLRRVLGDPLDGIKAREQVRASR